ncbi:MAG: terminase large subunit domain-containing protein [Flavisolibacter sp.]
MKEGKRRLEITLNEPHPGQQLVIDSKARFKVLLCGRRWGKTLVSQIIAIQAMLKGEKVAYVTPEFGLGKDFFREIQRCLPEQIITSNNKSDLFLELSTGGSLKFFSGEALDSFRGRKFHKVIIDEAAYIQDLETAWYGSIRPTLSDYQGQALFISTPRGKNFFYSLFLKGKDKVEGFESFHFATNNNPYFPKGEFEEARSTYPDAKFREEYLAEPTENSSNPIGTEFIRLHTVQELSKEPTIVYGIDVASHHDWTVIIGLDVHGHMTYFDRFQRPWEATMTTIKNLDAGTLKVVDATGVGDVVFQQLQQTTQNISGFKFHSQSKPAIVNQLINDIQKGNLKFNEHTAQELNVFEANRTATGYIKYEAQKGFHDDCVMALAIANHFRQQAFAATHWKLHYI